MLIKLKIKIKGVEKVFLNGEDKGVIVTESIEIKDDGDDVQMALHINALQDDFLKRHIEIECCEDNKRNGADFEPAANILMN